MAKQDDRAAKMVPYEEAIQITMELNQAYHSPEKRSQLMRVLPSFRLSIQIMGKISVLVRMFLSIPAAIFRIRGVLRLGMGA